jgi:(R,R)-butanediol dehydrogenase / meso-butanediol dehydrogenase / diacetyl reductase
MPDNVPGTMPAAVYQGDRTISVEELPVPEPRAHEVLIEVSHCGICGTDLHFVMEGWSAPGSVHGHEYSGVVVSTGASVADWHRGDRVVGGPGEGCGTCGPCRAGLDHLCVEREAPGVTPYQGAFATYKALPARHLFRVPDRLQLRIAALTEPLAVALRGVRQAKVVQGARVLVTGGGPIGLLTVAVLRALGIDDITVSEPSERRRSLAAAVGASAVITPDLLVEPRAPMERVDRPFHAAIECSGRPEAFVAALSQLDRTGVLVLSGTGMIRPALDSLRVILNELIVTGTYEYSRDDFDTALSLLAEDRIPTDLLVERDDVPLGGVQGAMERLVAGELAGKVLVAPGA